jgi:hypothetical protein
VSNKPPPQPERPTRIVLSQASIPNSDAHPSVTLIVAGIIGGIALALALALLVAIWKIVSRAVDDGLNWVIHGFGNEAAARHIEEKWRRRTGNRSDSRGIHSRHDGSTISLPRPLM